MKRFLDRRVRKPRALTGPHEVSDAKWDNTIESALEDRSNI